MKSDFIHNSVLLQETIDLLNINKDGVYVDGTAGAGGHSKEILKKLSDSGFLFCFDKDPDAINHLNSIFGGIANIKVVNSDFKYISPKLDNFNIKKIDGILLDLGVSSYQIDNVERGFCYSKDAFLDMRMTKSGISAYDVVNNFDVEDLSEILFKYGEEKFSWRIAENIELARKKKNIETTFELCKIVKDSIPLAVRRKGGNPCKRTFQAIRIYVNDELNCLCKCIDSVFEKLNVGGRFCIITFHSLEDRIVKKKFAKLSQGCICPPDFPVCVCNKKPLAKLINKRPIVPSKEELVRNNRAKSAKLRVIEKII